MKRLVVISVFCLLPYLLILGSCSHPNNPGIQDKPGNQNESDGPVTLTGVEALKVWLAGQPENTEANPYRVKVTGINLASTAAGNTLKGLYDALSRYVALDLSDCTGEKFANITPETAVNKGKITKVILPRELNTIPSNAFYGCTALVTADMPGVTTIEPGAFKGCEKLEIVGMEEVTEIKNTDSGGNPAFKDCTALKSVFLPNVVKIGDKTFTGCTSLESLTLGDTPPEIGDAVFVGGKPENIYVPASALDTYMNTATQGWTEDLKAKVVAQP